MTLLDLNIYRFVKIRFCVYQLRILLVTFGVEITGRSGRVSLFIRFMCMCTRRPLGSRREWADEESSWTFYSDLRQRILKKYKRN